MVADALTDFLARGAALPFTWGQRDCALWAADWIKERHGFDPAAALRGTYSTARECTRLLVRGGGLGAVASCAFASLPRTSAPTTGDVGIIETKVGPAMAICCGGGRWAVRSEEGILTVRLSCAPSMAWAV